MKNILLILLSFTLLSCGAMSDNNLALNEAYQRSNNKKRKKKNTKKTTVKKDSILLAQNKKNKQNPNPTLNTQYVDYKPPKKPTQFKTLPSATNKKIAGSNLLLPTTIKNVDIPTNVFVSVCNRTSSIKKAIMQEILGSSCNTVERKKIKLKNTQRKTKVSNTFTCDLVTKNDLLTITSLHVKNTQISFLKKGDFSGLHRLEKLDLSNNQIQTLPNTIFDRLDSLEELDLSNNQIQTLPNKVFDTLYSLEDLDLSFNKIQTLPEKVFYTLYSLTDLDLSNNKLSSVPNYIFHRTYLLNTNNLPFLRCLDLDHNPSFNDNALDHLRDSLRSNREQGMFSCLL